MAVDLLLCTEKFLDSLDQRYKDDRLIQLRAEAQTIRSRLQTRKIGMFADMFKSLEAVGHLW